MASPNVDLVGAIFAPWERGDFSSADWASYDIEFTIADGPARGTWTGRAAMAEAWRNFLRSWADFRAVAEEYRELDAERVLVLTQLEGRGRTSALDVGAMRTAGAHVFHLDGGEVMRLIVSADREQALADLGLASEADASR
jgi:ketosteroid isomerase-like protein